MLLKKTGYEQDESDEALHYAIRVIRRRLEQLRAEDRRDVNELFEIAFSAEESEEREEALAGITEILARKPSKIHNLPLGTELPESLQARAAQVGAKIRRLRKQSGMTQEELAEKAGILQSYISRLENDSHSPSYRTLEKIAAALGVPVTDIDPTVGGDQ